MNENDFDTITKLTKPKVTVPLFSKYGLNMLYVAIRDAFRKKSFEEKMFKNFAKEAKKYVPKVILTTVATTISKEDEEECTRLCERLGVTHRIRRFVAVE